MSNTFDPTLDWGDDCRVILGDMKLGQRIKEARLAADLSQSEVADAIGVTVGAVSAWETGVAHDIKADNLFRLADFLRVSARYLATGEQSGGLSKSKVAELTDQMADLSLEKQRIVLDLVRSLRGAK